MKKKMTSCLLLLLATLPGTLHAQFAPPIMGWSSWNTYHVNISDSLIRSRPRWRL